MLGPDLRVSGLTASSTSPRDKDTVTLTATVLNAGPGRSLGVDDGVRPRRHEGARLGCDAGARQAARRRRSPSRWKPKGLKGEHTIRATADAPNVVVEEIEGNNAGTLTVTVKGNKVAERRLRAADGRRPAGELVAARARRPGAASSSSTGGTDGSHAAQMKGTGGNAAVAGSPTWTSAPIAVTGGETYDLTAAVKASGMSSAPSLGVVYLNGTGQVVQTLKVLTAPLSTSGFTTLEKAVTVPIGVAQVRITLAAFAPTDLARRPGRSRSTTSGSTPTKAPRPPRGSAA